MVSGLRQRLRRMVRTTALAGTLAVSAFVIPDATIAPTEVVLVKVDRAGGVDTDSNVTWVLAVGSDARPGQDMTKTRGDALQLVGFNSKTGAATIIGVPRDSWVKVDGHGKNRINSALVFGGPKLMAEEMKDLIGIQPEYVFVTRFPYFINAVSRIGGIKVNNPRAFRDDNLKPKGFKKGRIHLSGYDAMAFGRIRYGLPAGDFDRSANQQRVLQGIQAKIRAKVDKSGFIEKGVMSTMKNTSTNLSPTDLFRLARGLATIKPKKVKACVVQGRIGDVDGASVVFPDKKQAQRIGDRARNDAATKSCE
jgi:polyisoprenyl-teichoic acid--peptidoglycan teichoic acid transferase